MSSHCLRIARTLAINVVFNPAFAQSTFGTITGLVTDSSGAVIPGAVVVATNTATGVRAETQSSNTGNYVIPSLQVGPYEVSVSVAGFKTFTRAGINLSSNDNVRIDVSLQVGQAAEAMSRA